MTHPDPETSDQRKARQFANLQRLAALGMDLATRAHARAAEQLDTPPAPDAPRPPIDYAISFAILSRAVRQTISTEMRLDAPARTRPSFRPVSAVPDPRRTMLRQVFHEAVAHEPDRAARRREIDERIAMQLAADPENQIPLGYVSDALCKSLGIKLDISRVPDEFLYRGPGTGVRRRDPLQHPEHPSVLARARASSNSDPPAR